MIKILKLLIPFTPHLANECLELLNCKDTNSWPKIDTTKIIDQTKIAVQVNGRTRDIISVKNNLSENQINGIVEKESKAKKYLENNKIIKTIFVKNKIINYIVANDDK